MGRERQARDQAQDDADSDVAKPAAMSSRYDVFLSYSSADAGDAERIQKRLEHYRAPRNLTGSAGDLRIRVFRDKSDQGLNPDYLATFKSYIERIPGFLVLGSRASIDSGPVQDECSHFLSTGKQSLYVGLLEGDMQEVLSPELLRAFPNAIYADFRPARRGFLARLIHRRHIHREFIRIMSAILSQKTGSDITFDVLYRRELRRTRNRWIAAGSLFLLAVIGTALYVSSTPGKGWHHTAIGRTPISSTFRAFDEHGDPVFLVRTEQSADYIDDFGHSGDDTHTYVHQLDDEGNITGGISYWTDLGDLMNEPELHGSWVDLDTARLSNLTREFGLDWPEGGSDAAAMDWSVDLPEGLEPWRYFRDVEFRYDAQRAFQIVSVSTAPPFPVFFSEDAGQNWEKTAELPIFTNETSIWQANRRDGFLLAGAPRYVDAYDPFSAGLFKSEDFGRTWVEIGSQTDWERFHSVVTAPSNTDRVAVSLEGTDTSRAPDATGLGVSPQIEISSDGGRTWHALPVNDTIDAEAIELVHLAESGNLFATIAIGSRRELVVFRRRSFWDRALQRFLDL